MLGWDRYRFDKKHFRTLYAELLFSHPVGSTSNVVHSSASWARNVDVLFSCLGGTGTDSIKIVLGHVTSNFCFCILWDMQVTVHFGASGERIVGTLFFMLRWDRYGFDKKRFRTCYADLLFLHLVGSTGHVVPFGASGKRIIDTVLFKLRSGRYEFDKKWFRTHYAELVFSHPVQSV
jgi:hypothetical protein